MAWSFNRKERDAWGYKEDSVVREDSSEGDDFNLLFPNGDWIHGTTLSG